MEGCGKGAYYNGFKMVMCGEKSKYSDRVTLCNDCELKEMGVIVGKKFYQVSYCFGRWAYEYEVLKINNQSVRVRCTFLDGRQDPQEYANTKDKTIERFRSYSKTFKGAVSIAKRSHQKAIKDLIKAKEAIPNQIEQCEKEINELNSLKLSDFNGRVKQ